MPSSRSSRPGDGLASKGIRLGLRLCLMEGVRGATAGRGGLEWGARGQQVRQPHSETAEPPRGHPPPRRRLHTFKKWALNQRVHRCMFEHTCVRGTCECVCMGHRFTMYLQVCTFKRV